MSQMIFQACLESQIKTGGRIISQLYGLDLTTATHMVRVGVKLGKIKLEDLAEHVIEENKKQIEFENILKKEVR